MRKEESSVELQRLQLHGGFVNQHGKVVAAFLGPDNQQWQGEPIMVTEDGTWWRWNPIEDKWTKVFPYGLRDA